MKKLIILLACFLSMEATAQKSIGLPSPIKCGIWYDYDKAGNRIKRYYDCKNPFEEPQPPIPPIGFEPLKVAPTANRGAGTTNSTDIPSGYDKVMLYPNPVQDKFYIRLPKQGTHTHFHLYDAKGAIITSGNIDGELYEGNIVNLASGEYHVVVYYEDRSVTFKITKI